MAPSIDPLPLLRLDLLRGVVLRIRYQWTTGVAAAAAEDDGRLSIGRFVREAQQSLLIVVHDDSRSVRCCTGQWGPLVAQLVPIDVLDDGSNAVLFLLLFLLLLHALARLQERSAGGKVYLSVGVRATGRTNRTVHGTVVLLPCVTGIGGGGGVGFRTAKHSERPLQALVRREGSMLMVWMMWCLLLRLGGAALMPVRVYFGQEQSRRTAAAARIALSASRARSEGRSGVEDGLPLYCSEVASSPNRKRHRSSIEEAVRIKPPRLLPTAADEWSL
uniref:Uncharacterized protein n=1 Tax=Anopheles coluzzii TaxID=1518534 RepID=A0A8W7PMQ7_ANOCL